jgi:hypothetical protein
MKLALSLVKPDHRKMQPERHQNDQHHCSHATLLLTWLHNVLIALAAYSYTRLRLLKDYPIKL